MPRRTSQGTVSARLPGYGTITGRNRSDGRVITDATGNPIDPNIHGGDIDPADDADTDSPGGTIDQGQTGGDIDWDYET